MICVTAKEIPKLATSFKLNTCEECILCLVGIPIAMKIV